VCGTSPRLFVTAAAFLLEARIALTEAEQALAGLKAFAGSANDVVVSLIRAQISAMRTMMPRGQKNRQ
jgi:hypothetical protein